jgi:hypothetical protein
MLSRRRPRPVAGGGGRDPSRDPMCSDGAEGTELSASGVITDDMATMSSVAISLCSDMSECDINNDLGIQILCRKLS